MYLPNYKFLLLLIILFFISKSHFAQSNYYTGTDELYGNNLKSVLHNKINNHVRFPYTSGSTDVWDILKKTDKDPDNSSNVLLLYTNYSVNAAQEYNSGNGWNREHVWAKSHGFPNSSDTAYTDVHHLRPSDISTNSARGNKDFDYGGNLTTPTDNRYDNDSWEPRDEIKGDVARMMLYMTVRYEGGSYDLELVDYVPSSGPNFGKKSVLLEWNRLDPVSEFERNRNRVIYSYQKNYNPFIDHPEFADRIYNSDKLIIEQAEQVGSNLLLSFSKELNLTEAEKVSNYQIDILGTPATAAPNFGGDKKKVVLTFLENFADTFYNVRVSNLLSATNEVIIPNSIALFLAEAETEVDTIAPAKPTNLIAANRTTEVTLEWDENSENDLSHYTIYRGVLQNFTPSQYTLLTTSSTNSFADTEIFDYRVYYKISAFDNSGNESEYSDEASILVSVVDENKLPAEFSLYQNYPNPFNPSTIISYEIGETSFVTLKIYDLLGNEVAALVNKTQSSGNYKVEFNASKFTSGIYFYTLKSSQYSQTRKMTILK
ncbi:MAG: endonuclease [Melioribacteraceae bacterium]|nr:endonuclease [Melioribacteraceae bacterium]